jgi:hypothetical protein
MRTLKGNDIRRPKRAETKLMRSTARYTSLDSRRNEDILVELK